MTPALEAIEDCSCNITAFLFEGLTDNVDLHSPLFVIFLLSYLIIIAGNGAILLVILLDSHLHSPMYTFLTNLAVIDIIAASNILPKLLLMLLTQYSRISFSHCIAQMYIFASLVCTEVILLASMAYDRYVAICHPLHYIRLMTMKQCASLSFLSWTIGFLDTIGHAVLVSKMSFSLSHPVDHFFCDFSPLLNISCSDTFQVELLSYVEGASLGFLTFMLVVVSYVFIICTIVNIKSTEGQVKAFSTCSSHLICVVVFYGTVMCLHMKPTSDYSSKQDKYFALLYVVFVPILNPFIYSLKNKEVKKAFVKLWKLV
ncbi:olfactory receptor 5AR1-like [Leptodactylus fuscus]|uniref:olfactory receptor 5AR1-like n=1 Tax=Leptodactylus fuscus TaxID=238119 RepID=UPI003F4EE3B0